MKTDSKKTLCTIQTTFKWLKVIAMIVFVCSIIGAVCCVIATFTISATLDVPVQYTDLETMIESEKTLREIITLETGLDVESVLYSLVVAGIACAFNAVLTFLLNGALKKELDEGTPFAQKFTKKLFVLGWIYIGAEILFWIIDGIVLGIYEAMNPNMALNTAVDSNHIEFGLFILLFYIICKYGSEIRARYIEKAKQVNDLEEKIIAQGATDSTAQSAERPQPTEVFPELESDQAEEKGADQVDYAEEEDIEPAKPTDKTDDGDDLL